jgi:hypothetical protein
MGCCKDSVPIDGIYVPLNKRFVEYGTTNYGKNMEQFPDTHMWIFTFYDDDEMCQECGPRLVEMGKWFKQYGILESLHRNVKWIIDDNISNNLILRDLNIVKTPVHFFCASDGKIIDIVYGFPTYEWLEKYILPMIRKQNY